MNERGDRRGRWERYTLEQRRQVADGLPWWWPYLCLGVASVVVGYLVVQFVGGG